MEDNFPRSLVIHLFGPFEVLCGGCPLPKLHSRKGKWLLALLALRPGKEVQRSWLAEQLWPESDKGLDSLNTTLHDLRKKLGLEADRIHATTHTIRLDLEGAEVDVSAFDAALAQAESMEALCAAVSLYRGSFLEDCNEEWVVKERSLRATSYVAALETLATRAVADGNHELAIEYLRKAIVVEETAEKTHRWLMDLLAEDNDYAGAMEVYHDLKQYLHREAARDPEAATTALYDHIRQRGHRRATSRKRAAGPPVAPPVGQAVSSSIPRPLTALLGRETELEGILARIPTARLVTLTGSGGVGKTRLATEIALELEARYAHGVHLIRLDMLVNPELIAQQIAVTLGVTVQGSRDWEHALIEHLHRRQMLLVLDNCEHLLQACADLARKLLGACPGLHLLVTSREKLGLMGEVVWNVLPLKVPAGADVDLRQCLDNPAIDLFCERATAIRPSFKLTSQNVGVVLDVCQRLDGLPLAIELAARLLETFTIQEVAARLHTLLPLVQTRDPTAPERHSALDVVLDWSWDLLSPAQRKLLCCQCVFANGWTLAAAEAVYAGLGEAKGATQGGETSVLLTQLVAKSLILSGQDQAVTRFGMLETMKAYGLERLTELQNLSHYRRSHGQYYAALAEEEAPRLIGPSQAEALDRLEAELGNLRVALEWATTNENDAEIALRITASIWRFYNIRGYHDEGKLWMNRALAAPCSGHAPVRMNVIRGLGNLYYMCNEREAARLCFEECLTLARELHDQSGQASALASMANIEMGEGNYSQADALFHEGLKLFEALQEKRSMALSLSSLATLACRHRSDFRAARELHLRGLTLLRELGLSYETAQECNNFAHTLLNLKEIEEAYACLAESLSLSERLGSVSQFADSLNFYAALALEEGERERAAVLMEAEIALRDRIEVPFRVEMQAQFFAAVAAVREHLGEARYLACRHKAHQMTEQEIRLYALQRSA